MLKNLKYDMRKEENRIKATTSWCTNNNCYKFKLFVWKITTIIKYIENIWNNPTPNLLARGRIIKEWECIFYCEVCPKMP